MALTTEPVSGDYHWSNFSNTTLTLLILLCHLNPPYFLLHNISLLIKRYGLFVHNKLPLKCPCPVLTTSNRISSAYGFPDLKLFAYSLLDLVGLKAAKEFMSNANWNFLLFLKCQIIQSQLFYYLIIQFTSSWKTFFFFMFGQGGHLDCILNMLGWLWGVA